MKCVILAGGHGTRLRPLTLSVPKPLIEFCNRSIIEYQIDAAKKAGVDHIILAVSESQPALAQRVQKLQEKYSIRIDCSIETSPMGTAGPLRLAEKLICEPNDDSDDFLVLNSDVICDYPLLELLNSHRSKKATITILVTKVENPSEFGVIFHDEEFRIKSFVEKPTNYVSNQINAGVYVLSKTVVNSIPLENTSIERDIFPKFVMLGNTFCHPLSGYWADIGKPIEYLRGQHLYLSNNFSGDFNVCGTTETCVSETEKREICEIDTGILIRTRSNANLEDADYVKSACASTPRSDLLEAPTIYNNVNFKAPVLVHPTAKIGPGSLIGPNVCIGANVVIGKGSRIVRSTIMEGANVSPNSYIEGSIIGWNSRIGPWVRIEGLSVLGESVGISEALFIRGCIVLPHKNVNNNIYEPGVIII
ncbi:GDP-mannose pyrophosphorylase, putative [Theileria equi strain WA]|uniref:mannose-1-phosphate guanylyltransferase n=1 Tax=Theileria equi strain WA TaxID=1537102 RepID=L0AWH9_THEEQ|nr:GDP-mannose pyrophosphorylase, putative [Theileria equi strain WA]AFZ79613.1 GDP-mannose pyrophosphorylase, putative [Theileria equi strain WA]|eukprot:XP_004829279.1 GDP-mannose pyrophosphorylase, putative [Theileria equi strain WA]